MTAAGADRVVVTHIGGPTVLIETRGWTILSDPTFDDPGRRYSFGWGTSSVKTSGPSIAVDDLPPVDVVVLSHDHHGDNLDDAGRALLAEVDDVVTTRAAARRLPVGAEGLGPWESTTLERPGRGPLRITATPCRHGPPLSRPIVGEVCGFALDFADDRGVVWISGDTVLYGGVLDVAERFDVDVALVHLGDVHFRLTGPVHYSMTAAEGLELVRRISPRVAVPVHYEGWSHFQEGRAGIDAALAAAPAPERARVRLVTIGERTPL